MRTRYECTSRSLDSANENITPCSPGNLSEYSALLRQGLELTINITHDNKQHPQCCQSKNMKLDSFLELLSQGLIASITAQETKPTKGKPLDAGKSVWIVQVTLSNGSVSSVTSSRGSSREWASLDTLNDWLRGHGISTYNIAHIEVAKV